MIDTYLFPVPVTAHGTPRTCLPLTEDLPAKQASSDIPFAFGETSPQKGGFASAKPEPSAWLKASAERKKIRISASGRISPPRVLAGSSTAIGHFKIPPTGCAKKRTSRVNAKKNEPQTTGHGGPRRA